MSLLDRIRECNDADPADYLPFMVGGAQVGYVRPDMAKKLAEFTDTFAVVKRAVALAPGVDGFEARSEAVNRVLRVLYDRDPRGFGRWCDERAAAVPLGGGAAVLAVERAAVPALGVSTLGAHLNGYVRDGNGIKLWVARRSLAIAHQPGELDQIAGGFVSAGADVMERLAEEAEDEAGIDAALMRGACPGGSIGFQRRRALGLQRGRVIGCDLELPADFTPVNGDGEIDEFLLMTPADVIDVLENTRNFKFDCALVAIDFLIRHGLIGDGYPDYREIVRGLRP